MLLKYAQDIAVGTNQDEEFLSLQGEIVDAMKRVPAGNCYKTHIQAPPDICFQRCERSLGIIMQAQQGESRSQRVIKQGFVALRCADFGLGKHSAGHGFALPGVICEHKALFVAGLGLDTRFGEVVADGGDGVDGVEDAVSQEGKGF